MFERLANADRNFIKTQVQGGFYSSEIEVVRDAVRKMREDKERIERFNKAVMKGVEDIEAGRTTPMTDELMQELIQDGIAQFEDGKPYTNKDTIPTHED